MDLRLYLTANPQNSDHDDQQTGLTKEAHARLRRVLATHGFKLQRLEPLRCGDHPAPCNCDDPVTHDQ